MRSACDSEQPTTVTHGQSWALGCCRHESAGAAFALIRALKTCPELVVRGKVELPTFRFSVARVLDASWTRTCVALVLAAAGRSAVASAPRTRPCHTGTRARPRLSTPAIFHPMPTAARRPAPAGYPLACQPSRYPSARPGMTHRDEQRMLPTDQKAPISPIRLVRQGRADDSEDTRGTPIPARSHSNSKG